MRRVLLLLGVCLTATAATPIVPSAVTVFPGLAVPTFVATFHSAVPSSSDPRYSQPVCPPLATYPGATTPVPVTTYGGDGDTHVACALNVTLPYATTSNASVSIVRIVAPPLSMAILLERPRGTAAQYNVSVLPASPPLVLGPGHQSLRFVVYGPAAAADPVCHDLTSAFYGYGHGDVYGSPPPTTAVASPPGSHACAYNVTVASSLYGGGSTLATGLPLRFPIANDTDFARVPFGVTDPFPSPGPPPASVTNAPTGRTLCAITGCTLRVVVVRHAVRTMIPLMPQINLTTTATLVAMGAGIVTAVNSSLVTIVSHRTHVPNAQADNFYARIDTTYQFSFDLVAHATRLNDTNASEATVTVRGAAFDFFGTPPGWVTNATLATFAVYFLSPATLHGRNATAVRSATTPFAVVIHVPLVVGLFYRHDVDGVATVNHPAMPNPPPRALFPRLYLNGNTTVEHPTAWGVHRRFAITGVYTGRAVLPDDTIANNLTVVAPYFDGHGTWLPAHPARDGVGTWHLTVPPVPPKPLVVTCAPGAVPYGGNRTFTCTFTAASAATLPQENPWRVTLGKLAVTPLACTSPTPLSRTCTFGLAAPTPLAATALPLRVRVADGTTHVGPTLPLAPAWVLTDTGGLSLHGTALLGPVAHAVGSKPPNGTHAPLVTVTLTFAPHGVTRTVSVQSSWFVPQHEWVVNLALLPGDLLAAAQTTLKATVDDVPLWLDGAWKTTTLFASHAIARFGGHDLVAPLARPVRRVVAETKHLLDVEFQEDRWTHSRWWTGVVMAVFVVWLGGRLVVAEATRGKGERGGRGGETPMTTAEAQPLLLLPYASTTARRDARARLW